MTLYRLVAPAQSRGQEPRQCQYHPPEGRRHTEVVDQQEDERTVRVAETVADEGASSRVAGDVAPSGRQSHAVGAGARALAQRYGDNRAFRVAEAARVNDERENGEHGGDEAEAGPN